MNKAIKTPEPSKQSMLEIPQVDLAKARILGRGLKKDRRLPLRVLRESVAVTQEQVAKAADMDQSEISRVEQRDDMKLSTLRKYAHALGAEIEVVATLKSGHRVRLDL